MDWSMNKVGGLCGIVTGLLLILGFMLIGIPFASAPPAVYSDMEDIDARLTFAGNLSSGDRTLYLAGSAMQTYGIGLLMPMLVALYRRLAPRHSDAGLVGIASCGLAIPLWVVMHASLFSFLALGRRYVAAGPADRPGLIAAEAFAESQSIAMETGFWILMGIGLLALSYGMLRERKSGWLPYLGFATAILGIVGSNEVLFFLGIMAQLLFIIWLIGTGLHLFRGKPATNPASAP